MEDLVLTIDITWLSPYF